MPLPDKNNNSLYRYAGMATQFFVAIGMAVFIGIKADRWLAFSFPLVVWVLPLLVICGMIVQVIRSTSRKNNGK